MKKRLLKTCFICLSLILFGVNSYAATFDWTGNTPLGSKTDWGNPGNWLENGAGTLFTPGAGDIVNIGNKSFTNQPTLNAFLGATTTIAQLNITSTTASTLTLNTALVVNGNIGVASGSKINVNGTSLQAAGGSSTVTNAGSINLVTGSFLVTAATVGVTNSGTISLTSTSAFTASNNNTTFSNTATGIVTANASAITFSGNTTSFSNAGNITITNNTADGFTEAGGTFTNSGNFSASAAPVAMGAGGVAFSNTTTGKFYLSNAANFTFSGSTSTFTNAGNFNATSSSIALTNGSNGISSSGVFNAKLSPITMNQNSAEIKCTGGIFNQIASNLTTTGQPGGINVTGGTYHVTGSTITLARINYIKNSAAITIDSTSVVSLGDQAFISNSSTGTFNAGTPNSSCTISNSANPGGDYNMIDNGGIFNLGSTSTATIKSYSAAAVTQKIWINNTGTFTLKSDQYGSAAFGPLPSTFSNAKFNGIYNVQRYFSAQGSGATADNTRNYRLLSCPVYTNTVSGINYYTLGYLSTPGAGIYTAGPTGPAGGFSYTNPTSTVYIYNESLVPAFTSFNSSNFKGLNSLSGATTISYLTGNTSATDNTKYLYAGNGFMVFYIGNNTANVTGSTLNKSTRVGGFYGPVDAATMTAIGNLNQGNIPVTIWWSGSTALGSVQTGYNLVGNPYASAIDWDKFVGSAGIAGPNLTGTIAVFNYASKNFGYYTAGSAIGGTNNANHIITSGQGFFIQVKTGMTSTLTFSEACKITGTSANFYNKPLMGLPAPIASAQYIRMKLAKDSVNTDEILLAFDSSNKNEYEQYIDVDRMNGIGNVSTLASYSKDKANMLAINHLGSIDSTTRIKLYVNVTGSTGADTLTATGFNSLDPRYDVYLIDRYKKDSLVISQQGKYMFNITAADTSSFGANRFVLAFHKKSALNYRLLSFTGIPVKTGVQLSWKVANEQNLTGFNVQKQDGTRQFLSLYALQSNGAGVYTWIDTSPSTGANTYRLRQDDPFDVVTFSNIISVNFNSPGITTDGLLTLYPNPVVNQFSVKINTNNIPAQVSVKVMSTSGQIMSTRVTDGGNIQQDISSMIPGTYIIEVADNNTQK